MQDHVIICGFGHVGYRIAELLHTLGIPFSVVALTVRPEWHDQLAEWAEHFVEGDARTHSVLYAAGLETARAVLVVTESDLANIEISLDILRLRPKLPVVVRVFDRYLGGKLKQSANVRSVFSPALLTAPVFVAAALGDEILRVFNIGGVPLNVVRIAFTENTPGLGGSVTDFCSRYGLTPLALHARQGAHHTAKAKNEPLLPGDELMVALLSENMPRLWADGHLPQSDQAARTKRHWRKTIKTVLNSPINPFRLLQDIRRRTPPVLRAALAGVCLLALSSVVIFRYHHPHITTWTDAIYFTVTILATVGFGDFSLRDAPDWLKLYGSGMMVLSITLLTILYSIITDYIVSLRVEQSMGRRPTRLTDHVVVVGMGDVGSRVVEELRRMKVPVVAIERGADQEAVPELQDQVQIIMADANKQSTLRKANILRARAAIITTTSDLESLQIAHRAESMNPALRSVLRLYDSGLARKLGGEIGVERTVNAAATAAASFVAAGLKTGVVEGFTLDHRLMLLRWLSREEMEKGGLFGASVAMLRKRGVCVLMRRSEEDNPPGVSPMQETDVLGTAERALILEEYDPKRGVCRPPSLLAAEFNEEEESLV